MTIQELKKELGLTNSDIAEFFDLTYMGYMNSSAKKRYETALEIEGYIQELNENVGLKTETLIDIDNAIRKQRIKLRKDVVDASCRNWGCLDQYYNKCMNGSKWKDCSNKLI